MTEDMDLRRTIGRNIITLLDRKNGCMNSKNYLKAHSFFGFLPLFWSFFAPKYDSEMHFLYIKPKNQNKIYKSVEEK